jgi:two-component system, LytTR family, sensor kinase
MKYQKLYNIVFSDKRSVRWKRHFFFWLAVLLYHVARIGMMFPVINKNSFLSLLELTIFWGLILNMFFSYSLIYYLIPKYFKKKKYWQFALGVLLVFVILEFSLLVNALVLSGTPVIRAIGYSKGMELLSFAWPGFIRSFGNPPLIFGLFLSLKTLKGWHLEQLKTETLSKENANAELQLLKAQVHPHFLFNTLNNIYSFSLYQSPQAGTLVQKLSGMLDYMIHDCEEKFVPLEKELGLIQDYMGLEKVRYGKRLDMQVEIHGDFDHKVIAPLLMIPFVENSFKHGTSQMLQHPWIKLEITTVKDQLFFKLSNSKPSLFHPGKQNKGIGLINVKKRLQLLYPGKHQLDVSETEDMFTVNMQILLEENVVAENKIIEADKALAYA